MRSSGVILRVLACRAHGDGSEGRGGYGGRVRRVGKPWVWIGERRVLYVWIWVVIGFGWVYAYVDGGKG